MVADPPLYIIVTFQAHKTLLAFHEQSYLQNHCLLSNKKGVCCGFDKKATDKAT